MLGHVATGQEAYYSDVKRRAAEVDGVRVLLNVQPQVVHGEIASSDVVWSLTGLDHPQDLLPADAEHFGLALLECMSAGLVPVVMERGGPPEILHGLPEYLKIITIEELASVTSNLIQGPHEAFRELRELSARRAKELSEQFDKHFSSIFSLFGQQLNPLNEDVWFAVRHRLRQYEDKTDILQYGSQSENNLCPPVDSDTKAILYMEERYDYALRATAHTLKKKLGQEWRFHVWHTAKNSEFIRNSLAGFECAVFHTLNSDAGFNPRVESDYNKMWKTKSFWQALGRNMRHVFIFQSDAWFPPKATFDVNWLKLDYIGAPWCHEGNWGYMKVSERPSQAKNMLHDTRQIPWDMRVGNGGVSLRNVKSMLKVLEQSSHQTTPQENEDVFYVYHFNQAHFRVADVSEASRFGLEILCGDVRAHTQMKNRYRQQRAVAPFEVHKPFYVFTQLSSDQESKTGIAEFLRAFF